MGLFLKLMLDSMFWKPPISPPPFCGLWLGSPKSIAICSFSDISSSRFSTASCRFTLACMRGAFGSLLSSAFLLIAVAIFERAV